MSEINWSAQHCGVHQAPYDEAVALMPDIVSIFSDFPDDVRSFTWDVKVHMLMPGQYPCIPNWHQDFIPRVNGLQQFHRATPHLPLYMWLSGPPLTQFKHGFAQAKRWVRFTQLDEHRGVPAADFGWRAFVRGTHQSIQAPKAGPWLRRHSQVYLNADGYQW